MPKPTLRYGLLPGIGFLLAMWLWTSLVHDGIRHLLYLKDIQKGGASFDLQEA